MEKFRKNPVLMGIGSAVLVALGLILIEVVFALIDKEPIGQRLSQPFTLILLIAGPICSGISTWYQTKKKLSGGDKKEM